MTEGRITLEGKTLIGTLVTIYGTVLFLVFFAAPIVEKKHSEYLAACEHVVEELEVVSKEVSGSRKHRALYMYVEFDNQPYKLSYTSKDVFNSYEKGDLLECDIYKKDGQIVQINLKED